MNDASREIYDWDAAYVLGGLSSRERATYESHLEGCARCAASVAELAGLPGILASLPPDEAIALLGDGSGTTSTGQQVAAPVSTTRRFRMRRPSRALVGVAAAVVFVGTVGYTAGAARSSAETTSVLDTRTMVPADGAEISADLAVSEKSWGTRFDWTFRDDGAVEPSGVYDLVAVSEDGTRTVVATWSSVEGTAGGLVAASSLPTDSLAAVEIVAARESTVLASADV